MSTIEKNIKETKLLPLTFLNRSTIVLGGSNSGKTKTTENILHCLADKLVYIYVFTDGSGSTNIFNKYTHKSLIKDKLDAKKLQDIWDRQKALTEVYNNANNMDVLKSLYNKVKDDKSEKRIGDILSVKERVRQAVNKDKILSAQRKKKKLQPIEDMLNNAVKSMYKKAINANKQTIDKSNLDEKQIYALKYINMPEPNMAIVMDDVSSQLKKMKPKEKTLVYEMFTQCRHHGVTMIFTGHNHTNFDRDARSQAFNTVFCGSDS